MMVRRLYGINAKGKLGFGLNGKSKMNLEDAQLTWLGRVSLEVSKGALLYLDTICYLF